MELIKIIASLVNVMEGFHIYSFIIIVIIELIKN